VRVALYGGSFDPPHVAHVMAATYLISVGGFDRVLVVPVFSHPFAKALAPYERRLRLCELALGWMPGVEISAVERSLETPSLTLRTLQHLQTAHPDWQMRLVVGSDVLAETGKWHAFDEVRALAPPLVLGRVGHPHPAAGPEVLPQVSGTEVRDLLARRAEPEAAARLGALVPSQVLEYIEQHAMYRG